MANIQSTFLCLSWKLDNPYYHTAFLDGEEQENCLGNLGSTFSEKETLNLDGHSQKCLIAYDQESKTLCIAFRGSKDFDDWMVNFKIKLIQPLDFDNRQLKTHTGFHNLAMQWKAKLLERVINYRVMSSCWILSPGAQACCFEIRCCQKSYTNL